MNNLHNTFKIICLGGSTTHCQEIDDFSKTWPSLLNSKLNNNSFVLILELEDGIHFKVLID